MSQNSDIDRAISSTWNHPKQDFHSVCTKAKAPVEVTSIYNNGLTRAGFDHDGKVLSGSVTRIIT